MAYKIKVRVEIVECTEPVQTSPEKIDDGTFELNISEAAACSIDDCEQALLQANYPAIRDALAQHLSEISKKKRAKSARRGA